MISIGLQHVEYNFVFRPSIAENMLAQVLTGADTTVEPAEHLHASGCSSMCDKRWMISINGEAFSLTVRNGCASIDGNTNAVVHGYCRL